MEHDRLPALVGWFNAFMSISAIALMAFVVVSLVTGIAPMAGRLSTSIRGALVLVFLVAGCVGLWCVAICIWLGARPSREETIRRWGRGVYVSWAVALFTALLAWLISA